MADCGLGMGDRRCQNNEELSMAEERTRGLEKAINLD